MTRAERTMQLRASLHILKSLRENIQKKLALTGELEKILTREFTELRRSLGESENREYMKLLADWQKGGRDGCE